MLKRRMFFIIILTIICISSTVFAEGVSKLDGRTIKGKADKFLSDGKISNTIDEDSVVQFSNGLNGILLGIGTIIVVIAGMMLGVQFMVESAEGKAKIMDKLLPFLIGAIIIFASVYIWSQFIDIADSLSDDQTVEAT